MKKLIFKTFTFILVCAITYNLIVYMLYGKSFLTSSCTHPNNQNYDFVLLGTSHGQVFYNHIVEKIVSKKMKNLATGAAGVVPQKIQLTCFFEAKNKTKQIIYLLDPWVLYSRRWNESNYILQQEGIEYSYFLKLIENHVDIKILFNYFRDKLTDNVTKYIKIPKDITPKMPISQNKNKKTAEGKTPEEQYAIDEQTKRDALMAEKTLEEQAEMDKAADKQRLEVLYNEGVNSKNLLKYSKDIEQTILLAKKNNAKIIFVIPPTLMGKMPGHDNTIKLLSDLKKKYKIEYFDFALKIQDPEFFWDREHLIKDGVEYFTQNYLKQILTD